MTMRPSLATALMFLLLAAPVALAQQQNVPRIGYVYPAGGQQGTTLEVKVGGRFLDGVREAVVPGRGIHVEVITHDKPLTGQQLTELREKIQELQKQGITPALRQAIVDARMKVGDSLRRNANPTLAEIVTLRLTIDSRAQIGARTLRLLTPAGLTNPMIFEVGDLPEAKEKDEKSSPADAELRVTLPAVINGRLVPGDVDRAQNPVRQPGQYAPGDVDRYRFEARKGQDLVAVVEARRLMPYLADAVPGWFQATLALYDVTGHRVAFEDDYRSEPDPVLHYRVPTDGEYVLEIKDALYRGREDFVYRIAVGELPLVTSVFPLGGRAGSKTDVQVTGWNLPGGRSARGDRVPGAAHVATTFDGRRLEPGVYALSIGGAPLPLSTPPFAIDSLLEAIEREPNGSPKDAQRLKVPAIVNGRIDQAGDVDVFAVQGRAGDTIVAEVYARRLSSPLDSCLEITDASLTRLAFNDDYDDKAFGLIAHQADSRVTLRLPAAGTYFVRVTDREGKGGPEFAYRLRISAPQPDFDLRVAPSGITAAGSASVPVTVYAIRKDGFAGEISLELKGAPGGFSLSGGLIPAGEDQVRVTLTAPAAPTGQPADMHIEGRAAVGGKPVVRRAVPVEEMMQAFAYRHLVPNPCGAALPASGSSDGDCAALLVAVAARGATRVPATVLSAQPVTLREGQDARVEVLLPPGYRTFENIGFELSEPPAGVSVRDVAIDRMGGQLRGRFALHADPGTIKPGTRGNLIVTITGERVPPASAAAANAAAAPRRRVQMGTLPAIAFTVAAPRG
jgi:hypothetical protein